MVMDQPTLTSEQQFATTLAVALSVGSLIEKLDEAGALDKEGVRSAIGQASLNGFSKEAAMIFNAVRALASGEIYNPPEQPGREYPAWFRGILEGGKSRDEQS